MNFKNFKIAISNQFSFMQALGSELFLVDANRDELWDTYLSSFPEGTNPIYNVRTEHDDSCCRGFVKNMGAVVTIKDGRLHSIWDIQEEGVDDGYQVVAKAMSDFVKAHDVTDVFRSKTSTVGTDFNHDLRPDGSTIRWDHLYLQLPKCCVHRSTLKSVESVQSELRASQHVFFRSLTELTLDATETVLELIASNTLYKGEEWVSGLKLLKLHQLTASKLPDAKAVQLYAWEHFSKLPIAVSRIKNHSIGTLLENISSGMDLEKAVKAYESIVAPHNYKRPKAIFTQKMLEDAKATIVQLGYGDSLQRRHAKLDDITVNNILFVDRDAAPRVKGALDFLDDLSNQVKSKPKNFDRVEEVPVDKFIKDILPSVQKLELYLENKHSANMVSLIAPENKDALSMLKWNNNFSWAYSGNITDSDMRSAVVSKGGRVDGVLRFTHQWNHDGKNQSLMDLHVFLPGSGTHSTPVVTSNGRKYAKSDHYPIGQRVGWNQRQDTASGGVQDVDFVNAPGTNVPVENITFPSLKKLKDGVYTFKIHNWKARGPNKSGFKAEIEVGGELYQFEHAEPLEDNEWVTLATATLNKGQWTVDLKHPTTTSSKELWGLTTNQFVRVSSSMFSPNHWDGEQGIGHKHLFFMLDGCENTEEPNGYYNEFLKEELNKHKRVFEAIGAKMHVATVQDQLSGVGFSLTKRSDVVLKLTGKTERLIKLKI